MAAFYGQDDELDLAFNFPFVHAEFDAPRLRAIVDETERVLPSDAWPVWTLSNHDMSRVATRWCDNDVDRVHCALMLLCTLRGTPVLYYGDELGLPDTDVPPERLARPGHHLVRRCDQPRCRPHADAVVRRRRAVASPTRAWTRGSRSATSARTTSPPNATTRSRLCISSVRCSPPGGKATI